MKRPRRNLRSMAAAHIEFSAHAVRECRRRGLKRAQVLETVSAPEQRIASVRGRSVFQRRYSDAGSKKPWLLRVVVKQEGDALVIITAYRTAKVAKYWQGD